MRCAADGGTAALAVLHRQSGRGGPHSAAAAVAAAPAAVGGAAKACPAVRAAPPLPGVPPTMHMPPTLCRQHRRRAQFVCYVFVCSVGWCAKTAAARSGFGVADFLWKEVLQLPMDRAPHDGFFSMPWKLFDLPATLRAPVWPVQQYNQYSRGVPYSKVHQKHIYIIYEYISTATHAWGLGCCTRTADIVQQSTAVQQYIQGSDANRNN